AGDNPNVNTPLLHNSIKTAPDKAYSRIVCPTISSESHLKLQSKVSLFVTLTLLELRERYSVALTTLQIKNAAPKETDYTLTDASACS
ncbi:hypothetical protein, partial [Citrobacter sp. Colony322]|uniref:hypothetical protein n=1 Tax=Citrobacter sp. Colony322 TaxID=2861801 RepID=UPI001C5E7E63